MNDARLFAPAAQRNRDAILRVLRDLLAPHAFVLEIASGSGEHAAHFAAALPGCVFQPSDPDPVRRASIDAWAAESGLVNLLPTLALDAAADTWTVPMPAASVPASSIPPLGADMVLCLNMIHIAPWEAALGLVRNAARALRPGGILFLYGPFRRGGAHTAPSNEAFDRDLRARNPEWCLRDLETVAQVAARAGFERPDIVEMPANNLSVRFRYRGPAGR